MQTECQVQAGKRNRKVLAAADKLGQVFGRLMSERNQLFTVICQWHPGIDACDNWQTVAVVLRNDFDAKDAANEACLYLIWDRQGQAQPLLVIDGTPKLTVPDHGIFDAQEYDDTITFARGKIVSCHELG